MYDHIYSYKTFVLSLLTTPLLLYTIVNEYLLNSKIFKRTRKYFSNVSCNERHFILGTVYYPTDPIFFQSINNQFMFRCSDGVHIDGKDRGLSKSIFKSCVNRDRFGHHLIADTSWLTPSLVSPLNIGQYVNNRSSGKRYCGRTRY